MSLALGFFASRSPATADSLSPPSCRLSRHAKSQITRVVVKSAQGLTRHAAVPLLCFLSGSRRASPLLLLLVQPALCLSVCAEAHLSFQVTQKDAQARRGTHTHTLTHSPRRRYIYAHAVAAVSGLWRAGVFFSTLRRRSCATRPRFHSRTSRPSLSRHSRRKTQSIATTVRLVYHSPRTPPPASHTPHPAHTHTHTIDKPPLPHHHSACSYLPESVPQAQLDHPRAAILARLPLVFVYASRHPAPPPACNRLRSSFFFFSSCVGAPKGPFHTRSDVHTHCLLSRPSLPQSPRAASPCLPGSAEGRR